MEMSDEGITSPVKAKSMLFCRRVLQDRVSGMPTLVDIISQLIVPRVPVRIGGLGFFCELTGCRGEYEFDVRILDTEKGTLSSPLKAPKVKWDDPTTYNHISITLNFAAEHEGDYEFRLFANGDLVDQKVLRVRIGRLRVPGGGGEPEAGVG
ncbi:unnamed protein product [marine sediment metagenome]|uniref:Ig-like domain-containing protein n=1 Tax=marine sediment metagenome TaxID=412755 RepID=X0WU80_9ZZZZ